MWNLYTKLRIIWNAKGEPLCTYTYKLNISLFRCVIAFTENAKDADNEQAEAKMGSLPQLSVLKGSSKGVPQGQVQHLFENNVDRMYGQNIATKYEGEFGDWKK